MRPSHKLNARLLNLWVFNIKGLKSISHINTHTNITINLISHKSNVHYTEQNYNVQDTAHNLTHAQYFHNTDI